MNPASFNSFIALLETISADIHATDTTREIIARTISDKVNDLFNISENDIH